MANTVKLKRGSGSDPGSSDLVVGEIAIRTDEGKLFTKKDDGSVAEISGGGGGENGLIQMAQTVTESVTLTTNYNAFSVQPTIASGITVTVPSGAVWAII
tara:strand:- start:280 stop:579 length:300 start_codon:yes stop_codon:yes gene_type:complete